MHGLAEFAYRNGIDLRGLQVTGPDAAPTGAVPYEPEPGRPLIPFGGGIDSIVTVESLSGDHPQSALFVVHPPGDRFAAIEDAAAVTGLPVVRVARAIDPQVRRSDELGFLNGHVPVTAVITAAAVVAAVLDRRDAVVLSNEWSASAPTLVVDGHPVNHQWSKGDEFERGFADLVLAALGPGLSVFSYLRPRTELWVSREFARLDRYHHAFRSCNRAFHQDPAQRLDHWCGRCDKCCFIDLMLAPFMERSDLATVFGGDEPLENRDNEQRFRSLVGLGAGQQALRVRRRPRRVPGRRTRRRAAARPDGQRAAAEAARPADQGHARSEHRRRRPAPTAGSPLHPGSLCTRRSPGPRSLTRRSASGAWASRDRPASVASSAMGCVPVLVDDAPAAPAVDGLEVLATGSGGLDALLRCDVVVKSPGISRYRPDVAQLEAAGIAVCGGLGLYMAEADPARVACITGTKGKSTTTALAVHLLTGLGYRARAGGNIGQPPWDPTPEPEPDYWVIETSSFQVPDLPPAPRVVAITSLAPDHLDWHGTVERYYADKLSLCTKPGRRALADGSDETLRAQVAQLGPHLHWVGASDVSDDAAWSQALGLPGPPQPRATPSIARAVLVAMGITEASDDALIAGAAAGFGGLPSRCHSLGAVERGRVRRRRPLHQRAAGTGRAARPSRDGRSRCWSVATTAASTTRPSARPSPAGGHPPSSSPCPTTARASVRPCATPAGVGWRCWTPRTSTPAVKAAFGWAAAGAVVLLSPAAPSFGRFADYRERSAAFAAAAARCGPLS